MKRDTTFIKRTQYVLLFLLISRLLAMLLIPLNDSTEARYGEIARIMHETGDWITLMHHYGVPFWAKPPLSTWLSAGSMAIFGDNQFAVRVPALLLSFGILGLVWHVVKTHSGHIIATTACLALAGSFYFLLDAGTVMTDPALLFCTTLMLVSFWHAVVNHQLKWGYYFFIGVGLGLLAKGPIALVLVAMPLFIWTLWHNQWKAIWKRLPWFSGLALALVIALPWYWLAEIKTPGFLNYFIVGEHVNRFLQPGWQGDKYGFAHVAPYGMIWVYFLVGSLPWGGVVLFWLFRYGRVSKGPLIRDTDGWRSYWLLAMLLPLLFFTFASNIIYPYVFPCLPAFAIFFAELSNYFNISTSDRSKLVYVASLTGIIFLVAALLFKLTPEWVAKSQNQVVAVWQAQQPEPNSSLIYWANNTLYSAQFYAAGRVKATNKVSQLCEWMSDNHNHYLVINPYTSDPLPDNLQKQLVEVATIPILKESSVLYRVGRLNCF